MVDVQIVTETSKEARWNRQADRHAEAQDPILSQGNALTKRNKAGHKFFQFF